MARKMGARAFAPSILLSIVLLIALAASFSAYVWAEKGIDRANVARYASARLAGELRQSSDDLTRMVRTYVVTGDPSYAQHFQDILDIRDGKLARPPHYDRIYWDFLTAGEQVPTEGARKEALLERMKAAGFSDAEFAKLAEAKTKSDALTAMEFEAMRLVAAGGEDAEHRAAELVFGKDYHAAKAGIMHPIDDFLAMVDARTQAQVEFAKQRALALRYLSIAIGLALVAALIHSYGILRRVMGGRLAEVHRQIAAIGSGNFSGTILVPAGGHNSVLGWLAETKEKLTAIEAAKQQAEARLRQDEQKLRSLFVLSPLGIARAEMDGAILECNEAFRRIVGRHEAAGLLAGGDGAAGLDIGRLRAEGRMGPVELELGHAEGRRTSIAVSALVVDDPAGAPYIWAIVEDITERLAREQQLARSNDELEQFAYVASHDLQTPLRNIVSYSQILERRYYDRLDADGRDFLKFVIDAGKHMSSMIHDLLQFSRVLHQGAQLEPVDCRKLFDQTLATLAAQIAETAASVSAGPLPVVMGDSTQLASLFQNLVGNALKYRHPERPPRIEIAAQRYGFFQWRFTVRDNGIGIDPEYHAKVFEMFQRLDPAGHPEGTGIGLAICRRIIHRMGGEIGIEASSSEGTTFFFTLNGAPTA